MAADKKTTGKSETATGGKIHMTQKELGQAEPHIKKPAEPERFQKKTSGD